MEERIQAAVDEALVSGPQVVSSPGAQWIKDPDRGWDKFPPLHYVSKYCEPYLKKYYPAGGGRTLPETQPTPIYASARWAAKPRQPIWPTSLQRGSL
jgi:hypothetical protein